MRGVYSSKRNLLFDLDGTLVDSVPAHARAFVETLRNRHPEMAGDFNYTIYAGWPTRDVFVALGFRDESELIELTERKQRLYREAVTRGEIEMYPGAKSLLERLQNEGRSLFLVTGASRISAQLILEGAGLVVYFQGITTADDVHPGKPSAEPYLQTMARFHLDPEDSLAIEDSESGVKSALDAGLATVLIHADFQLPDVIKVKDCEELALLLLS
jgi:HAD superfamily hydrolase (TIGR01509 family)